MQREREREREREKMEKQVENFSSILYRNWASELCNVSQQTIMRLTAVGLLS